MMLSNLDVWTCFAWLLAGTWGLVITMFVRACRHRAVLHPLTRPVSAEDQHLPRLSVVVAARNEAACIETCLRSLLKQDYPQLEVVAVNDRSTDATAKILDRLAVEFADRLKVVHVAVLPGGWFGKPHALTQGVKVASGQLLCFTDADCEFLSPSTLRTTIVEQQQHDFDFFTVAARYSMDTAREAAVVPCCSEAILMWLRPERVGDPRTPDVFANGAFILVKREAFDRIGGWEAVRSQISEDLQIARQAKVAGLRVGVAQGPGLYVTRSYGTLRESWNGWSRIFNGSLTPRQLGISLVRMLVLFALPLAVTGWNLMTAIETGSLEPLTHGAGLALALAVGMRTLLDIAMFSLVGSPLPAFVLAPLARLFVMAAMTRALLSHAGLVNTHWRGATFNAGQLVMPRLASIDSRIPETRGVPAVVPNATA
ncbi:MAG: glycosyltransferase [Planctomycetes bacterium]|nr:glycosyltransferase [Planctomycetota bacterium]